MIFELRVTLLLKATTATNILVLKSTIHPYIVRKKAILNYFTSRTTYEMILYLIYEIVLKLNSLDELKTEYIRSQVLFSLIIHTLRLSKDDKNV